MIMITSRYSHSFVEALMADTPITRETLANYDKAKVRPLPPRFYAIL